MGSIAATFKTLQPNCRVGPVKTSSSDWAPAVLWPDTRAIATKSAVPATIPAHTVAFRLLVTDTKCPSSYLFVVCIHSRLGEKGHLPCGFDTRFLSIRRFPQAQVVGWVAGSHLEGGQVAVLRLHVASARLRSERSILLLLLVRGGGSSSRPSATPPRTNVAHPCSPPTPFRGRVVC